MNLPSSGAAPTSATGSDRSFADETDAAVLGPAPLPVVRVSNRYRYRVTLALPV